LAWSPKPKFQVWRRSDQWLLRNEVSNPFLDYRVDTSDNKVGEEKKEDEYDMFIFGKFFIYKTGVKAPKQYENTICFCSRDGMVGT
jgi:hypothetical protein